MADDSEPRHPERKPGFLGRLFGSSKPEAHQEDAGASVHAREVALEDSPYDAGDPAAFEQGPVEIPPPLPRALAERQAADAVKPEPGQPTTETKRTWWRRLRDGLSRSSSSLGQTFTDIFSKRKLDQETLDDLEDALLRADLGVATAGRIREAVAKNRYEKGLEPDEARQILATEVERALAAVALPLKIDAARKPFVILIVGVNGSGKTTTIGKLAAKFISENRKVVLAAGDTFRAAAIEQLQIWGQRVGAEVVARAQGSDPASLAFDALKQSRESGADILLIDTAGRLQNRSELMAELQKVVGVLKKLDPDAPHAALLVLDATIGQNALNQVEVFARVAGVTGLVMTKLDGTARGGILVAVADRFKIPVHYIGVGESVDDLEPFEAADFARAIAGLDEVLN